MKLIRPNGMLERLIEIINLPEPPDAYGRGKPGRSTPEALHLAARQDRRRRPRHLPEQLRGRLLDLGA
jgi:hypothetical protein